MSDLVSIPVCEDDERRADLIALLPPARRRSSTSTGSTSSRSTRPTTGSSASRSSSRVPASLYGDHAAGRRRDDRGRQPASSGSSRPPPALEAGPAARASTSTSPATSRPYVLALPEHPDLDPVRRSTVFSFMAELPDGRRLPPAATAHRSSSSSRSSTTWPRTTRSFRRRCRPAPDAQPRNGSSVTRPTSGWRCSSCSRTRATACRYSRTRSPTRRTSTRCAQRISARRHARLVDYRMHDGRNAWAPVHIEVSAAAPVQLARGTALFTRLVDPAVRPEPAPGTFIPAGSITVEALARDPDLASVAAFETAHTVTCPSRQQRDPHPHAGARRSAASAGRDRGLSSTRSRPGLATAARPAARRPATTSWSKRWRGLARAPRPTPTRAPPARALEEVAELTDPLYARTLVGGVLQIRRTGQPALPLMRVRWRREDALRFPLCLSAGSPPGLSSATSPWRAGTSCLRTTA